MTVAQPMTPWRAGEAGLSRAAAGPAFSHDAAAEQDRAGQAAGWRAQTVMLRVTGGKPLRFSGELLAEGSSRRPGSALWHEVAIYTRADNGYAVSLRLRGASVETDRALCFTDLPSLESWLEGADPAADLHAGFDVADPSLSGAALALRAASLRGRAEELRRAYQAMLGELLFALETELAAG